MTLPVDGQTSDDGWAEDMYDRDLLPDGQTNSLRQKLIDAKLAGRIVDMVATTYEFRSNEQAADAALAVVVDWLRSEGVRIMIWDAMADEDPPKEILRRLLADAIDKELGK